MGAAERAVVADDRPQPTFLRLALPTNGCGFGAGVPTNQYSTSEPDVFHVRLHGANHVIRCLFSPSREHRLQLRIDRSTEPDSSSSKIARKRASIQSRYRSGSSLPFGQGSCVSVAAVSPTRGRMGIQPGPAALPERLLVIPAPVLEHRVLFGKHQGLAETAGSSAAPEK